MTYRGFGVVFLHPHDAIDLDAQRWGEGGLTQVLQPTNPPSRVATSPVEPEPTSISFRSSCNWVVAAHAGHAGGSRAADGWKNYCEAVRAMK